MGSHCDGRSAAGETLPPGIAGCTETAGDRKRHSMQQTSLLWSENCHGHPAFGDHHPVGQSSRHRHRGRPATSKKTTTCSRLGRWLAFFTN